ncbi:MAG: YgiQ family radical SAM protein [Candidatus Azobacteroides sp.]|nr:YgiQ family radical SAM protein [Candidatus Azobacteroides sp.]
MEGFKLTDWLPVTKKEVELRGWDYLDVIIFSGDAYVDHPSFGAAVIGRVLESQGLRVAIVPQPNWRDDLRDFKKLGTPRLFFAVAAGAMDSMVNHYTANKRLRSDDAYTQDGRAGMRPDYPSIVYTRILKELFPRVPVVIGGIEASMRRLAHYDYWQDQLKPGILCESGADLLIYGMGEKPVVALAEELKNGRSIREINIPQTAFLKNKNELPVSDKEDIVLFSYEECLKDKLKQAKNFRHIEEQSNKYEASRIIQETGNKLIIVNPPYPAMTSEELDRVHELPFTRYPHPKYKNKHIPAYEMIKFSVNIHRGCFGGCAFCTISAHQGKFIISRNPESIIKEVKILADRPDFKGYLSDLGGPSANMYRMKGKDETICRKCKKSSCIHPGICKNLNTDHAPLISLYKEVDRIKGVKKSFIGSGVRYDLLLNRDEDESINRSAREYMRELIGHHVSGRLKVAPEHSSASVLNYMRKPSFEQFEQFKKIFDRINKEQNLRQQLIPYFISSHPGCREEDMAELAAVTRKLDFKLEQVQDFTPTPMTMATEMYYTGFHPYTLEKVVTAKTKEQKLEQRRYFFWYKPEYRSSIINKLKRLNRFDLIKRIYG